MIGCFLYRLVNAPWNWRQWSQGDTLNAPHSNLAPALRSHKKTDCVSTIGFQLQDVVDLTAATTATCTVFTMRRFGNLIASPLNGSMQIFQ